MEESEEVIIETVELKSGQEYRFEADWEEPLRLRLVNGTAEIFGTELAVGLEHQFRGQKAALYTWKGCTFQILARPGVSYVAEDTPMAQYLNLHFALETIRNRYMMNPSSVYPTVLIVGPRNAGKTSIIKILTAYALKQNRIPTVLNLDPEAGLLTIPRTMSAVTFSSMLDVEADWAMSSISGPSKLPSKLPLVYFYGQKSPTDNMSFYKLLIARIALGVNSKLAEFGKGREGGVLIDSSAVIDQKNGYAIIEDIVAEMSVTVLVVVGHERLYSDMMRKYEQRKDLTVVKVAKSGGCVELEDSYFEDAQRHAIRQYFYGDVRFPLTPYSYVIDFGRLHVYEITTIDALANSFLPVEQDNETGPKDDIVINKIDALMRLQNAILGVTSIKIGEDTQSLKEANVIGFLHVSDVDDTKNRITVLAPLPGTIPPNLLLHADFRWQQ